MIEPSFLGAKVLFSIKKKTGKIILVYLNLSVYNRKVLKDCAKNEDNNTN